MDSNATRPGQGISEGQPAQSGYAFFIAYMVGLSAFGSFVNDMYLPSLPSMRHYFDCAVPVVQLGLTMGMVGLGVGQMILGPLSDKYGRKPILLWSVLLFIVSAVASIFSPTIHVFLVCRLFQGVGASGGYFLARTVPADFYGGRQLAKTMAVIGAINGFAPASSPVLGGLLSQHFGWKSVFVALTVIAVGLLLFSPKMKESLPPDRRVNGSVWQSVVRYKLLLTNRRFVIHVLLKGASLGVLFGYISSAPFIMQAHFGFRQDAFGLIMGGNSLMVAVGAMVALKFRLLKMSALVGGIGLMMAMAFEAVALLSLDSFWAYELLLLPILFFLGMIFTAANTLAMNEGRSAAGDASALLGIGGYLFGAVAAPLVGIGNIMHSTALVLLVLSAMTAMFAVMSSRLPADLDS